MCRNLRAWCLPFHLARRRLPPPCACDCAAPCNAHVRQLCRGGWSLASASRCRQVRCLRSSSASMSGPVAGRRWPTVAGRRGHNSGLAAPTSDCSVHLNGDMKEDIEINWDGTGHVLRTRG
ncbi:hypothetical protein VPH35_120735 [Triticum aestivum]